MKVANGFLLRLVHSLVNVTVIIMFLSLSKQILNQFFVKSCTITKTLKIIQNTLKLQHFSHSRLQKLLVFRNLHKKHVSPEWSPTCNLLYSICTGVHCSSLKNHFVFLLRQNVQNIFCASAAKEQDRQRITITNITTIAPTTKSQRAPP